MNRGFSTLLVASTSAKSRTLIHAEKEENKRFSKLSFLSPISVSTSDKNVSTTLTLSEQSARKEKSPLQPTQFPDTKTKIRRVKVLQRSQDLSKADPDAEVGVPYTN
ncbi:unnamed protein product [Peronospora destructor]|uniref:Uncharacterized protein n=1 Tax=Peronospora destructor TaxID=86335 RepID=A0AAV0V137_9STRA|nr:unnamed protein product [Peronospora destructor]